MHQRTIQARIHIIRAHCMRTKFETCCGFIVLKLTQLAIRFVYIQIHAEPYLNLNKKSFNVCVRVL